MKRVGRICLLSIVLASAASALTTDVVAGEKVAPAKGAALAGKAAAPRREGGAFVFSDGTRVRATDPSGRDGKVQRDGSISYGDGTRVSHDPITGESKIAHSDGTSTRINPSDPRRSGDTYVYSDGVRVRASDPSGKAGEVQSNGTIRYSDGTSFSHDVRSGETKVVHPDGSVEVSNTRAPHQEGSHFVWSDGQRAVATDPSGRAGKVQADGSIAYPDGTRVSHDVVTGDSKIVHADGRVETTPGTVPRQSGDSFTWSDGVSAPARDPSGNAGKVGGDGWIVYSDGSMVTHDPATGDSKVVHPDGSMIMGNSRTGETKSYDPAQERGISAPGADKANKGPGAGPGAGSNAGSSGSRSNAPASNNPPPAKSNDSTSNNSNGGGSTKEKDTTKAEKPEKEKVDKGGKGRVMADDQPSSSGPRLRMGGLDLTGQPNPEGGNGGGRSGASPNPGTVLRGIGPGGRPTQEPRGAGGNRLRFNTRDLVINPDPTAFAGRGSPTPINPYGGRR